MTRSFKGKQQVATITNLTKSISKYQALYMDVVIVSNMS